MRDCMRDTPHSMFEKDTQLADGRHPHGTCMGRMSIYNFDMYEWQQHPKQEMVHRHCEELAQHPSFVEFLAAL